jgi:hypothetical protein
MKALIEKYKELVEHVGGTDPEYCHECKRLLSEIASLEQAEEKSAEEILIKHGVFVKDPQNGNIYRALHPQMGNILSAMHEYASQFKGQAKSLGNCQCKPDGKGGCYKDDCVIHGQKPSRERIIEMLKTMPRIMEKEEILRIQGRTVPLVPKKSTDTAAIMIKRLKRRNRKDCIHYESHNGCSEPDRLSSYCVGVNCGCFKTKDKFGRPKSRPNFQEK